MSDGQSQDAVTRVITALLYAVTGAVLTSGALYVVYFTCLFVFPQLPDRLQVGTLLILVGIPIPGVLLGTLAGVHLWARSRRVGR